MLPACLSELDRQLLPTVRAKKYAVAKSLKHAYTRYFIESLNLPMHGVAYTLIHTLSIAMFLGVITQTYHS